MVVGGCLYPKSDGLQSLGTGSPGQTGAYGMSGDTQSRHCRWLMLVVILSHNAFASVRAGHNSKVASPAETIRLPSGLNATLVTKLV